MRFLVPLVLALCASLAHAQYPEKPVRMIVPFAPGGSADILARAIASRFNGVFGQPLIIDTRPGAAGNIGTELAARSKPDGYTLLLGLMNTHVANQALYPNIPFNGVEDFTPIAKIAVVITTMVVHPSVPAKNVKEFIAVAKANPGKIAYASAGSGSSTHLNAAIFARMAGIDMLHVPYKGGAPAVLETVTGTTQLLFTATTQTLPHVRAGKLRLLAVTGAKRAAMLPDVPTVGESLPGYEATVWYGVFGPAGMPKPLAARLNTDVNRLMGAPDMRKLMEDIGVEVITSSTPEQFLASMRAEAADWNKTVKRYNIKAD